MKTQNLSYKGEDNTNTWYLCFGCPCHPSKSKIYILLNKRFVVQMCKTCFNLLRRQIRSKQQLTVTTKLTCNLDQNVLVSWSCSIHYVSRAKSRHPLKQIIPQLVRFLIKASMPYASGWLKSVSGFLLHLPSLLPLSVFLIG